MSISFGTSGHRGIIGESFTHSHVRAIGQAVAVFLKEKNPTPNIAIGYDPRKGNSSHREPGSFTKLLADTLQEQGCDVLFFGTYTPTPVVSWAITHFNLDGGLILTASHNPPSYNGIKFNPANGAPAHSEITKTIQTLANQFLTTPPPLSTTRGIITVIEVNELFARDLRKTLGMILELECDLQGLSLAIDAKHGAVAATWKSLAAVFGFELHLCHEMPQSNFGNIDPNPTKFSSLGILFGLQKKHNCPLAGANDPDGDRHVVCDENGTPLSPEETCLIILNFLRSVGRRPRTIAATLASSSLIAKACKLNQINYRETAVGFKYLAPILEAAKRNQEMAFAVESSGGFSASFHTFEKCGFLPFILVMLALKHSGKTVATLNAEMHAEYGKTVFLEKEIKFEASRKPILMEWLNVVTEQSFPFSLKSIQKTDGLKLSFADNSWGLVRFSGTEPVARLYAESDSEQKTKMILERILAQMPK